MAFLRSKITLVVLGAVLVGGAGAMVGARSAAGPSASSAQLAANSGSSATGTVPNAAGSGTPTTSPGAAPTDTAVSSPTPTRVPPTPTPLPVPGQTLDLHGSVGSVGQTSFVLRVPGGSYTIQVTSSTQWPGTAKNVSPLAPGWQAEVQGAYTGGGNLTASTVDAQPDR